MYYACEGKGLASQTSTWCASASKFYVAHKLVHQVASLNVSYDIQMVNNTTKVSKSSMAMAYTPMLCFGLVPYVYIAFQYSIEE